MDLAPVPTDGTARTVTGPDGNPTRFSVRHHGGRLYVRAETARDTRESRLSLENRGRPRMQVRITAGQLPAPILYELHYRRAGAD